MCRRAESLRSQLVSTYVRVPEGKEGETTPLFSDDIPEGVLTAMTNMDAVVVQRKEEVVAVTMDVDHLSSNATLVAPGSNIASVRAAADDTTVNLSFTPTETIWDGGSEYDSTGERG